MSNRLKQEKSPYLMQHGENPVDWYPWCEEAFNLAAEKDLPIFLSIGYSTCHWCHVMAHESFEDEDIARILEAYKKRTEIEKYSHVATFEEIKENDFNLNIPRYVDTFEEEAPVDIEEVQKNIADIESELVQVQSQMKKYLEELGL